MWNELATLFLFGIVFLVVLKSATNWVYFGVGLLLLTVGLAYAIQVYKKRRKS
jgi:putative membrane protein